MFLIIYHHFFFLYTCLLPVIVQFIMAVASGLVWWRAQLHFTDATVTKISSIFICSFTASFVFSVYMRVLCKCGNA